MSKKIFISVMLAAILSGVMHAAGTGADEVRYGAPGVRHAQAEASWAETPAPARAGIITEPPRGLTQTLVRSGEAIYNNNGYLIRGPQSGIPLTMVKAMDLKSVYFKDLISYATTGAWVKGTQSGKRITIPCGQVLQANGPDTVVLAVGRAVVNEVDGVKNVWYLRDSTITEIGINIGDGGVYRLDSMFYTDEDVAPYVVTGFFSDNNEWGGFSDWNSVYRPLTDKTQTFPKGVEPEMWVLKSVNPDPLGGGLTHGTLACAVSGGKFYVSGLLPAQGDNVISGTIAGDSVVFTSPQYLGIQRNRFSYAVAATYNLTGMSMKYQYAPELVFRFDTVANRLAPANEKTALLVQFGKPADGEAPERRNMLHTFTDLTLTKFVEVAATPNTPTIQEVQDHFADQGYNLLFCYIDREDTEGRFMNLDKVFYSLYERNGSEVTKYVFKAETYPEISTLDGATSITEVPYNFFSTDKVGNAAIDLGGGVLQLYTPLPKDYGLQTIYYGLGERHESAIYWKKATNGVDTPDISAEAVPVTIYGIDGTLRPEMAPGINIVRMSDGSTRKILKK